MSLQKVEGCDDVCADYIDHLCDTKNNECFSKVPLSVLFIEGSVAQNSECPLTVPLASGNTVY